MNALQRTHRKEKRVGSGACFEGDNLSEQTHLSYNRWHWHERDLSLATPAGAWTVSFLRRIAGVIAIICLGGADISAESNGSSLYSKQNTWSETLIAARQNVLRWQNERTMPLGTRDLVAIWKSFSADFPAQAKWLTRDAGAGQEFVWLLEHEDRPAIAPLITRAASSVGSAAKIAAKQIELFRRHEILEIDSRWFDLYSGVCQYRDLYPSLERIWILDLRRLVQSECEHLLNEPTPTDDARWRAVNAQLRRLNEMLGSAMAIDLGSLRASIESSSEAMLFCLASRNELLSALAKQQPRWQALLDAAAEGKQQALQQLGAVAEEIRQFRHDLLLAVSGMKTFLSVPANFDLYRDWEGQFEALQHDLGNRAHFARVEAETFRREALILESDRDPADVVLRRVAALLADLQTAFPVQKLSVLAGELAALGALNSKIELCHTEARYLLFASTCRVRREISFLNPLLDFDGIVFIKRHRALFNHMCDQYYGMAATPGGGLYILTGAFGPCPQVRNVLHDSVVQNGRLAGQKLQGGVTRPPELKFDGEGNLEGSDHEGGTFVSPELSYDGRTILFAYVEGKGDKLHQHHLDPARGHWAEGRCYHLFKVNVDGSNLQQLTDWPLSENYYLCAYDAETALDKGRARGNYGIYLVDAFGNKELIYRDPDIASQSPIPLRHRPTPPVAPNLIKLDPQTNPAVRASHPVHGAEPEGTVTVINVYDSLKPWPDGTKITQLRVLQLLPMTVPSGAPPHETGLRARSASDSVVPVRHVLGTAPVEEDGSAHFVVPANREIFFQALDSRGLAVQSMRSSTYLQKGQQLVCMGCHEPRSHAPLGSASTPLAMRRAPSKLKPDVDGSNPFSYPRLVQPVLDKHCVQCHAEKTGTAPNLAREPLARHWYASYNSLVQKFGFHEYDDRYRTTPGHFGARASGLFALLEKGHFDVQLNEEEMHRLTLWLDCMSMFYGVYEKEGGEAQLRGEIVQPTLE